MLYCYCQNKNNKGLIILIDKSKINEILELLPMRRLALPIRDIPYPNSYCLWCNPSYIRLWTKLSALNRAWDMVRIYLRTKFTYIYMINIVSLLFSIEFHGVTAMRYQGFTEYKDTRLNSYDSEIKYILNPNEYVFYGTPVYAMCEGEVCEIYNKVLDNPHIGEISSLSKNMSLEYLYGNYICIKLNGLRYYYAGLQFNSMIKWKIGDKVRAGDILGKVGCCSKISKSPALHIECRSDFHLKTSKIPYIGESMGDIFLPLPLLKFEPFYEWKYINEARSNYDALVKTRAQDIKWQVNAIGSFVNAGSFIRKSLNSNV